MRAGGAKTESLDQVQYGLHYGVVTDNKDPESLTRVKVKLPWLDASDTDSTHWCQIVTPMGGGEFGWYALPDIEDVVVVMFIGGDISQPVVLGGVWSTTDNSPEPNEDGKNNFRGFRSRAGARLVMDDSGKCKVTLSDKTGTLMIGVGEFASDGAGPNVVDVMRPPMSGSSGVSISSTQGKIELTCKDGTLKITAGKNIKISAKTTGNVKTSGDTKLKGSSKGTITSSAPSSWDAPSIKIA